jgi:hypothetical protein
MPHLLDHATARGATDSDAPLVRYAGGRPITRRRYDSTGTRSGRLAADVDVVRPVRGKRQSALHRSRRGGELTTVGEGVWGDVDDPHHGTAPGSRAPIDPAHGDTGPSVTSGPPSCVR